MAEVTAAQIRELRDQTNAGMMDCKKALVESDGDMNKAVEWLRKKGLSSAAKRAGKAAQEGVCVAKIDGNVGVLAEINCETDFVARNEDFQAFADKIANLILKNAPGYVSDEEKPADASGEALFGQSIDGQAVGEFVAQTAARMGENVKVTRFHRLQAEGPALFESYIHSNAKIGVLVELGLSSEALATKPEVVQFGKDLSLHIAAEAPLFLNRDLVPTEALDKEKDIARTQAKAGGKPDNVIEKIVEGKANKYFQEVCLLEQKWFRGDNPPSVEKLLQEKSKEFGGEVKINRYVRYVLGETAPKGEE